MPKKPDACYKCKYNALDDVCKYTRCRDCKLHLPAPVIGERGQLVYCKCLRVKDGSECPYYEEVTL